MRYETGQTGQTRRMRVNDPDASPGWYDDDDVNHSERDDVTERRDDARPTTGRRPAIRAVHGSPYATRQFAAVRPTAPLVERDAATVGLPPLPRITRRIPAITRESPVPVRRAPTRMSAELRAFCEAPTGKRPAVSRGITLVPGSARGPLRPATRRPAPTSRRPNWKISMGAILLVVALAGALRVIGVGSAGPLGYDGLAAAAGDARTVSSPAGRRIAGADALDASANPWQAGAFTVPVLGGGGAAAPGALAKAPTPPPHISPPSAPPASTAASGVLAAPFTPWPPRDPWMAVPGHSPYRVYDYAGDPYAAAFGQCTWWSQHERRDENLRGMGNARYWAAGATARGYRVGATPRANATVVFQPYVQGASPVGHVGHVIAVYPSGWFLISEMNSFGNGGGWGRVSYRYAHAGPGVSFIY